MLQSGDTLELDWDSCASEPQPLPRLGLALALTRRGFDEAIRDGLRAGNRCDSASALCALHPQAELRPDRWSTILREAVEQCEQLWLPRLYPVCSIDNWSPSAAVVGVGITRADAPPSLRGGCNLSPHLKPGWWWVRKVDGLRQR